MEVDRCVLLSQLHITIANCYLLPVYGVCILDCEESILGNYHITWQNNLTDDLHYDLIDKDKLKKPRILKTVDGYFFNSLDISLDRFKNLPVKKIKLTSHNPYQEYVVKLLHYHYGGDWYTCHSIYPEFFEGLGKYQRFNERIGRGNLDPDYVQLMAVFNITPCYENEELFYTTLLEFFSKLWKIKDGKIIYWDALAKQWEVFNNGTYRYLSMLITQQRISEINQTKERATGAKGYDYYRSNTTK